MTSEIQQKIEAFFKVYKEQRHDKGYILIYSGQEPPGIFYLVSGQVREYDITDQGDEVVVNVFKPPAFFPMSWAINKSPNQYFFDAASAITVRRAPAEEVVQFLKDNQDVMFDLLSRVYIGTDGMLRRMAHLMGGNAETRLLYEIAIQCRRFGKQQSDGQYLIKLSEGELAKRAGMSRETVSRQLTKLNKNYQIKVSRQGLVVKDLQKIEKALADAI